MPPTFLTAAEIIEQFDPVRGSWRVMGWYRPLSNIGWAKLAMIRGELAIAEVFQNAPSGSEKWICYLRVRCLPSDFWLTGDPGRTRDDALRKCAGRVSDALSRELSATTNP